MLHHATRRADPALTPLLSILQAAAGRAWVRTRPARTFHRAATARQDAAVPLKMERADAEGSRRIATQWGESLR